MVSRDRKIDNFANSFFFFWLLLRLAFWPRLGDPCICQSPIGVYVCHFLGQMLGSAYSDLNFLHISQWITLTTQSCLVLHSFCANLLHSLIMWLMGFFLSPHNLHLLFCCVSSILALIWLVLMVLFCDAVRRDSVSLLKFPFLNQVQVFSCEMSFISRLKRL